MGKNINLLFVFVLSLCSCKAQDTKTDKTVVKDFDIDRYLGSWYEIARFDHRFERDLVGVKATYSYREDGKIKVVNSAYKETLDGKKSEAIGKAKIPNPTEASKLRVSFFWIFYSDYLVFELDEDYQWAVVGSQSDNYLWILSRQPIMEESLYRDLLARIKNRGYNTSKLIRVKQQTN